VPDTSRERRAPKMLKIEAPRFALNGLRTAPSICADGNPLGGDRNGGLATVVA
jgi:hypothetical protein